MIKINVRLLSKGSGNALQNIPIILGNKLAEATKEKLETRLRKKSCKNHPQETSSITIVADKRGIPKIEKDKFCCEGFSKSIQFDF